jgi:hypothetical protein
VDRFAKDEKDQMNLPKFWPNSGHWNDTLVSLCILLSLVSWALLAWRFGSFPFLYVGAALAPVTGAIFGVTLVSVLCTWFGRTDN